MIASLRSWKILAVAAVVLLIGAGRIGTVEAAAQTYTVTTTGTAIGTCPTPSTCASLRQAISSANANPGADTIVFDIAGSGVHVIDEGTLPAITEALTINGFCVTCDGAVANTAPLFSPINAAYRIVIDGIGASSDGFLVDSPTAVTIRGLNIRNYGGAGIVIKQGAAHVVAGNFIGTNETGTAKSGTNGALIRVQGTTSNVTVGGSGVSDRNLLSGAGTNAIANASAGTVATGLRVFGNYVGTNAAGTATILNSTTAIVTVSTGLQLGGSSTGLGNLISGSSIGIQVIAPATGFIQGNRIGTDAAGNVGLGNNKGILLQGQVAVGGTSAGAGNLISASISDGLDIFSTSSIDVLGNTFGTNLAGTAPLPNRGKQVRVFNSDAVDIGGFVAGAGNRFGGDSTAAGTGLGISIEGTSTEVRIVNNIIGLGTGGQALGHKSHGIFAENSGNDTTILGNTVVSSGGDGIRLLPQTAVTALSITGNLVGETPAGIARGNAGQGILIGRATGVMGGPGAGDVNVVAHNGGSGVGLIFDSAHMAITRNRIFDNSEIGIDIENDGPTDPDDGDADGGANGRLNVLEKNGTILADGNRSFVPLLYRNVANTQFDVETYRSSVCQVLGSQGEFFLGDTSVTTAANGFAMVVFEVDGLAFGDHFSALVFDAAGNTSEFSRGIGGCNTAHRPPQDVDCSFEITAADALAVMNRLAGLLSGPQAAACPDDPALSPGDANGDGAETLADATAIRRYLAGLNDIFGNQVTN